ncbi:MAG: twin-arginine translocase TatA/TatE family subunit [Chloroflexi bacterium]|nr:twin-arginine translocase TatA/TatE family subunit [Chloroflexota bacterium]
MGVFGIGPMELILVLIVALVVFGPQRLPEMAAGVGRAVREFRKMSAELTAEVSKVTEELTEIQKTVTHEVQEVKQAATITLDLNSPASHSPAPAVATSSTPAEYPPITGSTSTPVEYQPAVASSSVNGMPPASTGSFDQQVAALLAEASAADVRVNGSRSDDPFQNAVLQLQHADEPVGYAAESGAAPVAAAAEQETEPETARSAAPPVLPMQWYSGT